MYISPSDSLLVMPELEELTIDYLEEQKKIINLFNSKKLKILKTRYDEVLEIDNIPLECVEITSSTTSKKSPATVHRLAAAKAIAPVQIQ